MASKPGLTDFVAAAFNARPFGMFVAPNWIGLAAFGLLGVANPGFWVLGAGLEVGYLLLLATNARFQRTVSSRPLSAARDEWNARIERLLTRIDSSDRARYAGLAERCRSIIDLQTHGGAEMPHGIETQADSLGRLSWTFLDFEFPIMLNGKRLSGDESEALWEELEKTFNTIVGHAAKVDADRPWTSPNAEALDKQTLAEWITALDATPLGKQAMHTMMMADNGVVPEWQSYLANLAMVKGGGLEKYWTESEVYRCKGGNQQLATRLVAAIGAPRVLTRTPVSAIAVTDRGVRVTLTGGKVLEAEHAILAVPPSVWNRIAIDPALPATLAPQMGTSVKCLLAFKAPFWRRAELAPDILSDGPVNMTWHATDGQEGVEVGGEALVAFSSGPSADACREWGARRIDTYLAELQKIYRGVRGSYVRARFMDWPGDRWTMGGYSFPAPGQVTTQGPTLHEGIGRLHFAGEHTSYAFVGFMEGALNSGAALARRIATREGIVKGVAA